MTKVNTERLMGLVAERDSSMIPVFNEFLNSASEVVLFGSAAIEKIRVDSDIDLLFVGNGARFKNSWMDCIWIPESFLTSPRWLGSELATHVAEYGIWLKGRGEWRSHAFVSESAVTQKCERILMRLSKIYVRRHTLSQNSRVQLLSRSVLDMQRAIFLSQRVAVPPTPMVVEALLKQSKFTFEEICSDELLGDLGRFFLNEFLPADEVLGNVARIYGVQEILE